MSMLPTVIGLGASFIAPKIMSQFRDQKIKVVKDVTSNDFKMDQTPDYHK